MDSLSAFARGQANRGKPVMVFDWEKAARLIKEYQPQVARAGLCDDWEWTGGTIYHSGKPFPKAETYTYLSSTWATPELEMDGERFDCYVTHPERSEWDAETYWPKVAVDILKGE